MVLKTILVSHNRMHKTVKIKLKTETCFGYDKLNTPLITIGSTTNMWILKLRDKCGSRCTILLSMLID